MQVTRVLLTNTRASRLTAFYLLILALLALPPASLAQDEKRPQRGFHPGSSYALSGIETVSTSSGNLMLNVPLGSLPPGRGGSPGFTLGLTYNSKLYDTHVDPVPNDIGQTENRIHLNQSSDGGWRYALPAGYTVRLLNRLNEEPGPPCARNVGAFTYQKNAYVWKMQVIYPDGSAHEFRPYGHADQFSDGFFNVSANGWTSHVGYVENDVTASCTHSETLATTAPMVYYSTDGSYTRLVVEHDGNPADHVGSDNPWTLYYPDGGRVVNAPGQPQRKYDRNNNYVDFFHTTHNNHPAYKIVDQLGRYIIVERIHQYDPSTGLGTRQDYVYVKGVGGEQLVLGVHWKQIYVYKQYKASIEAGAMERGNTYLTPWEGVFEVVDQITLPQQAGGLSYSFGYNAGDYAGNTQALSHGWGELNSVTLPSGAKAWYGYALDGESATEGSLHPLGKEVLNNKPESKKLVYRQEHDLTSPVSNAPCDPQAEQCRSEEWLYYGSLTHPQITAVTNPDGGTVVESFGPNPTDINYSRPSATVGPDGTKVERLWRQNRASGMTGLIVNPYVKTQFTSVTNAAGDYVRTAIRDYSYDKNGNVTAVREYDWVDYGSAHPDASGPPVIPPGVAPRRVTTNGYYNPTPDADTTTCNSNCYVHATAPGLSGSVAFAEVSNGAQILSRTEFTYDDPATRGNLIEQRSWDSSKDVGLLSPNPVTGSRLDETNSVSISHEYDENTADPALRYGNRTRTTDARGSQTKSTYGPVGGFSGLYPTKVEAAYGTTVEQETTAEYDFDTGLVTRTTDPNNVSTTTAYDAFGRPTLVAAAAGQAGTEARVRTVYADVARRVVTRRDLNAAGDEKLVSVEHYDQLGRLRLSRELEDSAVQSETDEGQGIKVQTRYRYGDALTDPHSYVVVSNSYRAATSGAAAGESTMGWTVTKSDRGGRAVEERTVVGASLPAPWGGNTSATGTVGTVYDAEFTTVTDQQGKVRRSVVDGLGRLVRVDEPNAADTTTANKLGAKSSPAQPTCYSYDAQSNLVGIRQGGQWAQNTQTGELGCQGGQQRSFQYSSLSRLLSAANPESGTFSYAYNDDGSLWRKTDARGVVTTLVYDELGRLKTRTYSDKTPGQPWSPAVTYEYDGPAVDFSRGRLTKVSSSASETHYSEFDALGRVTRSRQVTGGQPYDLGYKYDRAGNLISQIYPSGREVITDYDASGDIGSVTGRQQPGATLKNYASEFAYAAHGAVEAVKLGNGLWEHAAFNSRRQPTRLGLGATAGGSELWRLENAYGAGDNNGNVRTQTLTAPGLVLQQSYEYDELSRLKSARETVGAAEVWKQTFLYDVFGNRRLDTALDGNGQPKTTPGMAGPNPVVSAATNRIVPQAGELYEYDLAGNLTKDQGGVGSEYDGENRQVRFNGGPGVNTTGAAYSYDGDGRRVRKETGGQATVFVYDAFGKLAAEYASTPPAPNGTQYVTADRLGTPRVVTGATGQVKARHDYAPFGEELSSGRSIQGYGGADGLRQRFTSKERDAESGLDYFLARYYSPQTGRFTSPDEFTGGPDDLFDFAGAAASNPTFYADLTNPQSLNKYQYTYNNPINLVDPDGHDPCCISPEYEIGEAIYKAGANILIGMGNVTADHMGGKKIQPYEPSSITQAVVMSVSDSVSKVGGFISGKPRAGLMAAEARTTAIVATEVANAARAGKSGAAGALQATTGEVITATSISARNAPKHVPKVQELLDNTVKRGLNHGGCCEPQLVSKAIRRGVDPTGASISVVRIRRNPSDPKHGTPMSPCPSCRPIVDFFKLRIVY